MKKKLALKARISSALHSRPKPLALPGYGKKETGGSELDGLLKLESACVKGDACTL
jgi:hypothetical protein